MFNKSILVLVSAVSAVSIVACDKGRQANSLSSQRAEKARCERGLTSRLNQEIANRNNALLNEHVLNRTYISDGSEGSLVELIKAGNYEIISEKDAERVSGNEVVLNPNCDTLTAQIAVEDLGIRGTAKILEVDMNKVVLEMPKGEKITIEKIMPEDKDALTVAKSKDAQGLNVFKFTSESSVIGKVEVTSETGVFNLSDELVISANVADALLSIISEITIKSEIASAAIAKLDPAGIISAPTAGSDKMLKPKVNAAKEVKLTTAELLELRNLISSQSQLEDKMAGEAFKAASEDGTSGTVN